MKNIIKKQLNIFTASAILCTGAATQQACRKVDKYFDKVTNTPQVDTSPEADRNLKFLYANTGYKPSYAIGDTVTWSGQFFLNKGLPTIHIGNANAVILHQQTYTPAVTNKVFLNEVVRFVITEEMGTGQNRPVTVSAGGITIGAPDITVTRFVGLAGRTDTTLYVAKLATWQPENPGDYYLPAEETPVAGWDKLPWINGASATAGNIVYFDSNLGIYRLNNDGAIEKWLGFNDVLAEEGETFRLHYIVNTVVDHQHTAVYVSARVTENTPDEQSNYIFRLMKIDPVTKSVVTLNRTLLPKDITQPGITAEPVQGPVKDVPLVAMRMTWTPTGLYFFNAALAKPAETPNTYMRYRREILIDRPSTFINFYAINTLCHFDPAARTIRVLAHAGPNSNTGIEVAQAHTFRLRPDGGLLYTIPMNVPFAGFGVMYYDVALGQTIYSKALNQQDISMQFTSFDTDTATQYTKITSVRTNTIKLSDITAPYCWTIANTGDIISYAMDNSSSSKPSLFAANIDASKMYCYAGTEKGLFTNRDRTTCISVASQVQESGPAKYVDFAEQNCSLATDRVQHLRFFGADQQGAVYFFKMSGWGAERLYSPVRFYRIYPQR